MKLNRDTLMKAYPATPQEIKDEISQTLQVIQANARPTPTRYARRLSFASVLVSTLLIATLATAIAVGAHYGVFDFISRFFGGYSVLPQASELVQINLGSLDLPHTIITAEEALYDGGSLQVVYSIEGKNLSREPIESDLDDPDSEMSQALAADVIYYHSGLDWFFLNVERHSMTNGSFSEVLFDEGSGKIYCYVNLQLASSGIIPQGDFTVALPVAGEPQDTKILEFTMKENVTQRTATALQTEQETVIVKSAFVTPIRVYVNLRVEVKAGVPPEEAQYILEDWRDAVLVDASGNELGSPVEMYPGNTEDGKASDYHYTFLPVDLAEVYLAPTTIDKDGNWVVDMNKSLQVK